MLQAAGTGPMKCAALCPKGILVGRVVDQTNRAVKHAQALLPSSLSSVNILRSFIIHHSSCVNRLQAPWHVSQNLVRTELSIAAGYVRYGGLNYSEGSAILVSGPKPKTLSGAQGLQAYIKQRSLNYSPRNFFARSRACIPREGTLAEQLPPCLAGSDLGRRSATPGKLYATR